ncbi:MAG: rhomboid family intramembrane serine protease [Desulfobulbaceae bacterium]|nr:rhomboid family intramembrane serine protease [Desulfobulbaceae bacterium]
MSSPKKNSLLCPSCRRLISRSESKCPYCEISNPGSPLKNNPFTALLNKPEGLITILVYINVAIYIISILIDPGKSSFNLSPMRFLSPSHKSLFFLGSTGTIPVFEYGRWWSLISANFLHGSLLHIIFNMIAIRQIGPLVINEYGPARMLVIYLAGGVAGFVLSCFPGGIPFTIGASAGLCSLIGATLYYGKSRGGIYGQNIYSQVSSWAISIFIFGFMIPGINNWAHGGGMAAGALLGLLLGYRERTKENSSHTLLAATCVIASALTMLWAIGTAFYIFFIYR